MINNTPTLGAAFCLMSGTLSHPCRDRIDIYQIIYVFLTIYRTFLVNRQTIGHELTARTLKKMRGHIVLLKNTTLISRNTHT